MKPVPNSKIVLKDHTIKKLYTVSGVATFPVSDKPLSGLFTVTGQAERSDAGFTHNLTLQQLNVTDPNVPSAQASTVQVKMTVPDNVALAFSFSQIHWSNPPAAETGWEQMLLKQIKCKDF